MAGLFTAEFLAPALSSLVALTMFIHPYKHPRRGCSAKGFTKFTYDLDDNNNSNNDNDNDNNILMVSNHAGRGKETHYFEKRGLKM
jgi:hypothetical protein